MTYAEWTGPKDPTALTRLSDSSRWDLESRLASFFYKAGSAVLYAIQTDPDRYRFVRHWYCEQVVNKPGSWGLYYYTLDDHNVILCAKSVIPDEDGISSYIHVYSDKDRQLPQEVVETYMALKELIEPKL